MENIAQDAKDALKRIPRVNVIPDAGTVKQWEDRIAHSPQAVDFNQIPQPIKDYVFLSYVKKGDIKKSREMLKHNANIDVADSLGWTPLHHAVHKKDTSMILLLIRRNANINALNHKRSTPLHLFLESHRPPDAEIILLLVRYGASVLLKDVEGTTPIAELINHDFSDAFWITLIGFDREAGIVAYLKSPIQLANRLFKQEKMEPSIFGGFIQNLLENQNPIVLKILIMWNIALKRASKARPHEQSDLLFFARKMEDAASEIFNCSSMDRPINVQMLLQPEQRILPSIPLFKYQINALGKSGLLDICLTRKCKFLFEKPQISGFVNDIFWSSAKMELLAHRNVQMLEDDTIHDTTTSKSQQSSLVNAAMSTDLGHRFGDLMIMNSRLVRISYGMRSCPVLRFVSEALARIFIVVQIVDVSVNVYGDRCGIVFSESCSQFPFSRTELTLFVLTFSICLYEVGELYQKNGRWSAYYEDEWKLLDSTGLILTLTWFALRFYNLSLARVFLACAAIPLCLGLLRYLSVSHTLGVIVATARAMLMDMVAFLVVYIICVLGFGVFFLSLYHGNGIFQSASSTVMQLFSYTLGNFEFTDVDASSPAINSLAQTVLIVYVTFTSILLINLLVARMTNAYQRVDDKALQEWSFSKTKWVQQNLILVERHPFCMLLPPLNLITALCIVVHYRFLPMGISVGGTVSNFLMNQLSGSVRALAFVMQAWPAIKEYLRTIFLKRQRPIFKLYYLVTNTLVLAGFVGIVGLTIGCPVLVDEYFKPLPKIKETIEHVVNDVPSYLYLPFEDELRDDSMHNEVASASCDGPSSSPSSHHRSTR